MADQPNALDFYPAGIILPWASNEPPPKGWHLCDGSPGTPDLRGRFLMGASTPDDLLQAGGSTEHSHTVYKVNNNDGRGFNNHGDCGLGSTDAQKHLPPHVQVNFIIKL